MRRHRLQPIVPVAAMMVFASLLVIFAAAPERARPAGEEAADEARTVARVEPSPAPPMGRVTADAIGPVERRNGLGAAPVASPSPLAFALPLSLLTVPAADPRPAPPLRYVTPMEFTVALRASPWPEEQWESVRLIAQCESGLADGTGRLNAQAAGAHGEQGVMQIYAAMHPRIARSLRLNDLHDALLAAYIIYLEYGGFGPWSCGGAR